MPTCVKHGGGGGGGGWALEYGCGWCEGRKEEDMNRHDYSVDRDTTRRKRQVRFA